MMTTCHFTYMSVCAHTQTQKKKIKIREHSDTKIPSTYLSTSTTQYFYEWSNHSYILRLHHVLVHMRNACIFLLWLVCNLRVCGFTHRGVFCIESCISIVTFYIIIIFLIHTQKNQIFYLWLSDHIFR